MTFFPSQFSVPTINVDPDLDYAVELHHLFPTGVANAFSFLQQVALAGLYQHANFGVNGIALPSTVEGVLISGDALHSGPHPDYDQFVERMSNEIRLTSRDAYQSQPVRPPTQLSS